MATRHWDDDELIRNLYGIGPEDGHLRECAECAARWQVLLVSRKQILEQPQTSEGLLAAQRRTIYSRLEEPETKGGWLSLAPATVATAAVVLLAVLLRGPAPVPRTPPVPTDAELVADIYTLVQSNEPQAVVPIHALFEARQ